MNMPCRSLAPLLPIITLGVLATVVPAAAQVPNTLLQAFFSPSTAAQTGAGQGYSVAVDGGLAVVGSPSDDIGGAGCGAVKVYDAVSGARLHLLTNPSPAAGDQFGFSVAVSGTRVVVGAHRDDTTGTTAGSAYVYDLTSATPTVPMATLTNPSPAAFDFFGNAVAISGTRVVVGAVLDDSGAINAGSAYVYDLAGATPTVPVITLTNPSPATGDQFGASVALSGARLVVGAIGDDTGTTDSGSAYVYDLTSATPTVPVATLNNPGPGEADNFGWSVAVSDTRVVVGAYKDDTGADNAGSAYVYNLASATPTAPIATLDNPSPAMEDQFGTSVGISGMRVVVGASMDNTGAAGAGSAYVYNLASPTPAVPSITLTNPSPAAGDQFGTSVAVSGARLVVGAMGDDTIAPDAGSAYVYDLASASPTLPRAVLNGPSPSAFDYFGSSVAVSGTRVVVGAYRDDTGAFDAGTAYVFDLASATPRAPVATLAKPGPAMGDQFGSAVAFSGTRVVVGAYGDDTGAADAGSAYVYDLASATPTVPIATLTNPSPAASDYFGFSVAASGTRIIVGAYGDNTGATDAGSAYAYDLASATSTLPVATLAKPSPAMGDQFGFSVAVSGARIVIGAPNDSTGAMWAGSAYVYDLASPTPTLPVATLNHPNSDEGAQFGFSVAISGARVVVGAVLDDAGASGSGSAYVYDLASATPTVPVVTLTNPSPAVFDNFGYSVAVDGTRVVVGAYRDDTAALDAGSAYVYDLGSATPTVPVARLNNLSPAVDDRFGFSVAVHGTTIVAGAPFVDAATADRGAAYVFGLVGPTLHIVPAPPGFATISWTPANLSGFVLQYTDRLAPINWVNAPSGATNPVTVPFTNATRFYRLFKP
jgi:hypothetical protein